MANSDGILWQQRFENFGKALARLDTACKQDKYSDLERAGLVQMFEFTMELAWKTLNLKTAVGSHVGADQSPRMSAVIADLGPPSHHRNGITPRVSASIPAKCQPWRVSATRTRSTEVFGLKDLLFYEGFDTKTSRETIRKAFETEYLTEEETETLLDALIKRNVLSHPDEEKTAEEAVRLIKHVYAPVFRALYDRLQGKRNP